MIEKKSNGKISRKDFRKIVESYYEEFPDWILPKKNYIIRFSGPVGQVLGFQRMTSGGYRFVCSVCSLIIPRSDVLFQMLKARNNTIEYRQHERLRLRVVQALKEEIKPSVSEPLDLDVIRQLCEDVSGENFHVACFLAGLNAYLGEKEKAMDWIKVVENDVALYNVDWFQEYYCHIVKLRQSIVEGTEQEYLGRVIEAETLRLLS